MIPFIVLMPLAVTGGGLLGLVHERFLKKRLVIPETSSLVLDSTPFDSGDPDAPLMMASGDLVQVKYSERAAKIAMGMSAVGMYYPPLALAALPVIGYSAYSWLRTRYLFEQPWFKSPLRILALLALGAALVTGHLLAASLVLGTDLAARKWIANLTKGSRMIEEDGEVSIEGQAEQSTFMQRVRYLAKIVLKGEPRWEWFPALLARVSMGLFFAISGWNKLFTAAHWKGLLSAMIATGLPFPKFMSLLLASIEFYGGALLTVGFMSTFFSIALAFAMIVAIVTVEIPFVIPPGLGPLDWLDWFLYLPQVLYVLIFLWLIIKGPGPYSADAVIARKLGFDDDSEEEKTKQESDKVEDKSCGQGSPDWDPALQPA